MSISFSPTLLNSAQIALNSLPKQGVVAAWAYGSKVLENSIKSQLDLLVVVDTPSIRSWHSQNFHLNSKNYTFNWNKNLALSLANSVRQKTK